MAKQTEPAAGENEKPAGAPPKKSKKMLIIIIVAVLALGGGGVGAFFVIKGKGSKPPEPDKSTAAATGAPAMEIGAMLMLDPFTLNLAPGSAKRVLKITLALEMKDEASKSIATERLPIIKDRVIMYLTTRRDVEIDNDIEQIKADLLRRLKAVVGEDALKRIHITEKLMD